MTMNPLPPQAYTRETLVKASQWILTQSDAIKAMATTPDNLVSLYLKTRRDGESALDRPSIQNFKNELKNLTGLMGELEKPPGNPQVVVYENPTPQAAPQPQSVAQQPQSQQVASQQFMAPPPQPMASAPAQQPQFTQSAPQYSQPAAGASFHSNIQSPSPASSTGFAPGSLWLNNLDPQSRIMIQEVKESLNLTSDTEALRMMIKIGHKKALDILK